MSSSQPFLNQPLADADPYIASLIQQEESRQQNTLDMIASENYAPRSVLECQGSVLTNKYAEGYPARRYYGGCSVVDQVEEEAIRRAKQLFSAEHANVQPHSGATANAAAFQALINPGDTILGLSLAHGGHLTHGSKVNFSGRFYNALAYEVDPDSFLIDMDQVEELAHVHLPDLLIAGWSSYPRQLDFARFRAIADAVDARLLVDMAHFSGLVAAGLYPNPVPYADVVTSTVHKTLDGPRSGMILCSGDLAKKIDSAVFPGQQGGPLMHVVAGKAVAFALAQTPEFRERQQATLEGARIISDLVRQADDLSVVTGSTDVHFLLLDLREHSLSGLEAEQLLEGLGVVTNRNAIPFDPEPPTVTSGLRLGTSALATRGFRKPEFTELGEIIVKALSGSDPAPLKSRVESLAGRFPVYQ